MWETFYGGRLLVFANSGSLAMICNLRMINVWYTFDGHFSIHSVQHLTARDLIQVPNFIDISYQVCPRVLLVLYEYII